MTLHTRQTPQSGLTDIEWEKCGLIDFKLSLKSHNLVDERLLPG